MERIGSVRAVAMKSSVTKHGDLVVTRYDLKKGDKVPLHKHAPEYEHITICASGEIVIDFPNSDGMLLLRAGDMIDYASDQQEHEIEASTDAVVFNIPKKKAPTE